MSPTRSTPLANQHSIEPIKPSHAHPHPTVAVVGAGRMGLAIAGELARRGCTVRAYDVTEFARARADAMLRGLVAEHVDCGRLAEREAAALLRRVSVAPSLADALRGATLAVESVPEDAAVKVGTFARLGAACRAAGDAAEALLLGSCTLGVPLESLAAAAAPPLAAHVLGVRFFHPVWFIDEVELTGSPLSEAPAAAAATMLRALGLVVRFHTPGGERRLLSVEQANAYYDSVRERVAAERGRGEAAGDDDADVAAADGASGDPSPTCSVCMAAPRNAMTAPCGHWETCAGCARRILESSLQPLCVVCRAPIERIVMCNVSLWA